MNRIATAQALIKIAKSLLAIHSGFEKHSKDWVKEFGKSLGIHSDIEFHIDNYKEDNSGYGEREGILYIYLTPKQYPVSDIEHAKNQIFKAAKAVYTHRQYSIDEFKILSINPTENNTNVQIHFKSSDF